MTSKELNDDLAALGADIDEPQDDLDDLDDILNENEKRTPSAKSKPKEVQHLFLH